ncbi:hypothetical protein C8N25_12041 [Algoriphagus antarcticus]|uniref:Uncharacterized protein n=1 Tax=Algoriphagus antarcticus TaxID=238540 RepID=A0A3E0DJA1_9BACT|nr:hypothetical protein C8N25_12041 [Algoriphagus antarcticus]
MVKISNVFFIGDLNPADYLYSFTNTFSSDTDVKNQYKNQNHLASICLGHFHKVQFSGNMQVLKVAGLVYLLL